MPEQSGPSNAAHASADTMTDITALRSLAALIREVTEAAVAGITHEESIRASIPGLNGMNWVLGHVTHVNASILALLETPAEPSAEELSRYAPGAPPLGVAAEDAVDFEILRDALVRQGPLLDEALGRASAELLARPAPPGLGGDVRSFLHFITFHQSYHAGQLGLLRRALGHDRAFG